MKGIILAGGSGSRLRPITIATSKQLLSVYDKPMIYYPLSVLMQAGIRDILIITTSEAVRGVQGLLGPGDHLGVSIDYAVQDEPRGIADAFRIGADHIGTDDVALVLGDNIFHSAALPDVLRHQVRRHEGCVLFTCPVPDPHRYGVAEVDAFGRLRSLVEKPPEPESNLAVTGLYLYDNAVVNMAHDLRPSARAELEITDINRAYLRTGSAKVVQLGRDDAWFDAGTYDSLLAASRYVQLVAGEHGERVGCVEETALRMGYITTAQCHALGERMGNSPYGNYVTTISAAYDARMTAA